MIAANVDLVLIAEHLEPTPSLGRIERMLAAEREKGRQRQREMRERHRVTGGPRR